MVPTLQEIAEALHRIATALERLNITAACIADAVNKLADAHGYAKARRITDE